MADTVDASVADTKSRIEAELRDRLDRQLRLQPGPVEAQRLLNAIVAPYERDIEAKIERAEVEGNEVLADDLDAIQREILSAVIEKVRASIRP